MRLRLDGIAEVLGMLGRAGQVNKKVDALRRDFAVGVHADIVGGSPTGATGFLSHSNVYDVRGVEVVWANVADYARYVDIGTGQAGASSYEELLPEEEPVAFALHWPGMKAQPFMRAAIAKGLEELEDRIERIAKEIG